MLGAVVLRQPAPSQGWHFGPGAIRTREKLLSSPVSMSTFPKGVVRCDPPLPLCL